MAVKLLSSPVSSLLFECGIGPIVKSSVTLYRVSSLVFFLSGCSALIFETVWFRVTSIVLGSSIWSASAVLMAFMAGLGLGNAIVAFRGSLIKNPIKLYMAIEVIIGVSGVAVIYLLPVVSYQLSGSLSDMLGNDGLLNFARFAIAFLLLLIPAIAMGSTLPVLHKALHTADTSFAKSIAHLYGWNTFGAVAGTLVAEFFLIYWLGVRATAMFACGLNLAAAFILYRNFSYADRPAEITSTSVSFLKHKKLLIGPAIAGMLLLMLEVIWFRYLSMVQQETSTLFSIMLAVVLFGIASGGIAVSRSKIAEQKTDTVLLYLATTAAIVTTLSFFLFQIIYANYFRLLIDNQLVFVFSAFLHFC
ncbi:MAG: hypothetical protein COA96_07040 [SAR86 cluster bacterium]|uniref:Spermidine synthase n=1 Tax=SAR86 cluster bacterium TaxID=2030880 RepID=A0A2A5B2L1_9GAMM|nr:MAG: hypothetical protein COA96_07040 [SAR86 cluster bacterium]